jgi:hypothetical protein
MTKHHDAGVQPANIEITDQMVKAARTWLDDHYGDAEFLVSDISDIALKGVLAAALNRR